MPVGDGAALGARREVGLEPRLLRRAGAHAGLAVQRNDVPVTQVVAVVALPRGPGDRAEVAVVARAPAGVVLVVPRGGAPPRFVATPRGGGTARQIPGRPPPVCRVPPGGDGPPNPGPQPGP